MANEQSRPLRTDKGRRERPVAERHCRLLMIHDEHTYSRMSGGQESPYR